MNAIRRSNCSICGHPREEPNASSDDERKKPARSHSGNKRKQPASDEVIELSSDDESDDKKKPARKFSSTKRNQSEMIEMLSDDDESEDGARSTRTPIPPRQAVASPNDLNLPQEFSQTLPVAVTQADRIRHSYTPGSISSEISSRRVRGFQGLGTTAPTGSQLEAIKRKYLKKLDELFFPGSQASKQLGPKVYNHVYKMIQNAKSAEECHIFLLQCAVKAGVYGPTQVSCALDGDYPAGFDPNDCKTSAVHNIIADAHAEVTAGEGIVRLTLNSIENCPGTCRRIKEGEAAAIAHLSTILADFYHDIGGSVSLLGMMGTSTGWELIAKLLDPSKFKVYIPCNYHLSLLAYYRRVKNKSYEDRLAAISYGYYLSCHNFGPQYRPVFQALADRTKSCMVIDDFTSVKNIGTGTNSSSGSNSQRTIDTFFSASSDRNPKIKRSKAVIRENRSHLPRLVGSS